MIEDFDMVELSRGCVNALNCIPCTSYTQVNIELKGKLMVGCLRSARIRRSAYDHKGT